VSLFLVIMFYIEIRSLMHFFQDCRMFENRVPHMLDGDYTPYSALDIFVKDLVRLKSTYAFFGGNNFI
jgi:3-hydroxyisobutyrate dehydrogenase-like beta-hydroxyacid dehydrogenase